MEVGTHSPWVSRLLQGLGYEVIVANARQVKLISSSSRKDDRLDAQMLARLARFDPGLLRPIRHRSEQAQQHLMKIRVRATLVETRTSLVNAARWIDEGSDPVARKLAVLLHRLWVTGEVYEPLRNSNAKQGLKQRAA